MAELKAGARALIVGCVNNPINVGKECVLEMLLHPGGSFIDAATHSINLNATEHVVWVVTGSSLSMLVTRHGVDFRIHGTAIVRPRHLMLLDDPDTHYENGHSVYDDHLVVTPAGR